MGTLLWAEVENNSRSQAPQRCSNQSFKKRPIHPPEPSLPGTRTPRIGCVGSSVLAVAPIIRLFARRPAISVTKVDVPALFSCGPSSREFDCPATLPWTPRKVNDGIPLCLLESCQYHVKEPRLRHEGTASRDLQENTVALQSGSAKPHTHLPPPLRVHATRPTTRLSPPPHPETVTSPVNHLADGGCLVFTRAIIAVHPTDAPRQAASSA